jgi:hypothetical protein
MTRAEKRPAPESESRPQLVGTFEERSTGGNEVKRAVIEAVKHYLRHGHSDFEARRIRAMGAALRKGGRRT